MASTKKKKKVAVRKKLNTKLVWVRLNEKIFDILDKESEQRALPMSYVLREWIEIYIDGEED